jgi:hemolysin D
MAMHDKQQGKLNATPRRVIDPAFLPAALEIRDTPPSSAGRWMMRAILALIAVALTLAIVGRIDVVAVAQGQLIPSGRSKIVQSLDGGVVRQLHVREGQQVRQGELLLEFDGSEWQAVRDRSHGQLEAERQALAGALALRRLLGREQVDAVAAQAALLAALLELDLALDTQARELQLALLLARHQEFSRRRDALLRRDAARVAERRSLATQLLKLERSLPIAIERSESARALLERQLLARQQWLEQDLERIALEHDVQATRERLQGLDAEIAAIHAERVALEAGEMRGVLTNIEQARRAVDALAQDLLRAEERLSRLALHAPVAGIVQQLNVRAAGEVLKPAEPIMTVVPQRAELEVEALVHDRDVGFIAAGQQAAVKVDAFEFTRYGLLPARVRQVSAEAVEHPRLGLVFPARVVLSRAFFDIERGRAELVPGMAVQVEIHTGRRRIIDYFLSPLGKAVHDSIRER